jgi:hypothetical protein
MIRCDDQSVRIDGDLGEWVRDPQLLEMVGFSEPGERFDEHVSREMS